jgi:hypothetical protein
MTLTFQNVNYKRISAGIYSFNDDLEKGLIFLEGKIGKLLIPVPERNIVGIKVEILNKLIVWVNNRFNQSSALIREFFVVLVERSHAA